MAFTDLFSEKSDLYASARPRYPDSLFQHIALHAPDTVAVWDCGTGNGQAAISLGNYFVKVYASDPSSEQIEHAILYPNVEYSVQPAESTSFPDALFDAITISQALHWFDFPLFFAEVNRVLKPKGVFAAWGYSWFTVSPEFDALLKTTVLDVIHSDWAPQNQLLWDEYKNVPIPFERIETPEFSITEQWSLHQLLAYVHSWSATRICMNRIGDSFFERAREILMAVWSDPDSVRSVAMPIYLVVGKKY